MFWKRAFPQSFGRIAFPQNLHTKKLGEILVFYAVILSRICDYINFCNSTFLPFTVFSVLLCLHLSILFFNYFGQLEVFFPHNLKSRYLFYTRMKCQCSVKRILILIHQHHFFFSFSQNSFLSQKNFPLVGKGD